MNLKELSDILGLSQTTVSRALNGYPEVSEKTRIRVQTAATTHGYAANTKAKSLATGRSMAIGHVIPLSQNHEMVNPVFSDFIAGAGEIYSENGYDMLLSVVKDVDEAQSYRNFATKRSVDGVIVHGPRANDPRVKLLRELGLPFVVHGRMPDDTDGYSWVDMNNGSSFERATGLLLDLGHRNIALLNGVEVMDFAIRRRSGYEAALRARGVTPNPALIAAGDMTEHYGYQNALEMLRSDTPPTAFLTSSYLIAIGVRRAISEMGLSMGRDVSVVTHDDDLSYLRNGGAIPLFTASRSSVRDAGKRCAEVLINHIKSGDKTPHQELWEAELMLGESTCTAPT